MYFVFVLNPDTDESRFRLPEREAAKGLLFLWQTPTPNLIPNRLMTYPYADQFQQSALQQQQQPMVARSISFTSPVPGGERRHEQYYSNPKVAIMSPVVMTSSSLSSAIVCSANVKNDYASMPIDLTKPRLDDAMQQYLTERAFRDSKMKQTQVYRPSQQLEQPQLLTVTVTSTTTLSSSSSGGGLLSTVVMSSSSGGGNRCIVSSSSSTGAYQPIAAIKRNIGLLTTTTSTSFPIAKEAVEQIRPSSAAIDVPPNSFDALKNSPNPSKVSYVKVSQRFTKKKWKFRL